MNWYSVMIQVVEDETPESFHCTIRDTRYWIPKATINPETRCVLGECDVRIEIEWSKAKDLGLVQVWKTERDSGRAENVAVRSSAASRFAVY